MKPGKGKLQFDMKLNGKAVKTRRTRSQMKRRIIRDGVHCRGGTDCIGCKHNVDLGIFGTDCSFNLDNEAHTGLDNPPIMYLPPVAFH